MKDTPVINILTYKLPFDLSNQIYNEFQNRFKEATYLIDNYKTYQILKEHKKTVELILSISIFHKRVIANFEAAVKFYGTVSRVSQTKTTIKIGSYIFNGEEKNKLLAVILNYRQLIENFSIPFSTMEYSETREFLNKLINLEIPDNEEGKN